MRAAWLWLVLGSALLAHAEPQTLNWPELVPQGTAVLLSDPTATHDEQAPAAQQTAPDAPVVRALDQQQVRIPGYIVPLDTDHEGRVLNFFLVPYYGACIHVPPPPANQIIYVQSSEGIVQEALWQPYWVEGTLHAKRFSGAEVQAGYQLSARTISLYALE